MTKKNTLLSFIKISKNGIIAAGAVVVIAGLVYAEYHLQDAPDKSTIPAVSNSVENKPTNPVRQEKWSEIVSPSLKYTAHVLHTTTKDTSKEEIIVSETNTSINLSLEKHHPVFSLHFYFDDKLIVFGGSSKLFEETATGEQWLVVYDIPAIFEDYKKNQGKDKALSVWPDNAVEIYLPDIKRIKEFLSLRVNNEDIEVLEEDGLVAGKYNLEKLWTKKIKVELFYFNSKNKQRYVCNKEAIGSVIRSISSVDNTPIRDTLKLFLEGDLTQGERESGFKSPYLSTIGDYFRGVNLKEGVLTVDLEIDKSSLKYWDACEIELLPRQIEMVAKQFKGVKEVKYTDPKVFTP
ncbi:MAG: hypothetical protein Q8N98_00410 [bacterium]|nr:hypothetical protein [bacterium]